MSKRYTQTDRQTASQKYTGLTTLPLPSSEIRILAVRRNWSVSGQKFKDVRTATLYITYYITRRKR
jgi:hypothetical protein